MPAVTPILATDLLSRDIAVVALVVAAFALVSRRLHGSPLTPAMVFVAAGLVLGNEGLGVVRTEPGAGAIRLLAEATLALVLFTDASSIKARVLAHQKALPSRLLLVGLPLTIVAGTLVGLPLLPGLAFFEVVVLAVVLAPTDAALGETVVSDERLPSRLRQGLNVESGLNDGICVPLLFAAIAFAELEERPSLGGEIVVDLVVELAIALGIGVAVAVAAGFGYRAAQQRDWVTGAWAQVVPLATAVAAYTLTAAAGGSGFVAAFAAGLAYRRVVGAERVEDTVRLTGELGSLLSAVTFFSFGAVVVGGALNDLEVRAVLYAVLSLTVVRMLPVAVAMVRSGEALPTVAFAGWFGPRGLASIVFALVIVEDADLAGTALMVQAAAVAVLLSVVLHGLSAPLLTSRYVAWQARRPSPAPPEAGRATTPERGSPPAAPNGGPDPHAD